MAKNEGTKKNRPVEHYLQGEVTRKRPAKKTKKEKE